MIWLVISSMLIIAAYTAVASIKEGGIPASLSATFYRLKHPMLFFVTMATTAFLLLPVGMEVGSENSQWAMFLASIGMLLVGGAPNFKAEDKRIHNVGAVMSLLFSQIWVSMNCYQCLLLWLVYIIYIVIKMSQKTTDSFMSDFLRAKPLFLAEIAALLSVYLTLLMRIRYGL